MLAMDVARHDQDLLVVTENGYGKRTPIDEYRKTSRGAKGVKTITLTERKGALAGALVVREHQELVFISQNGMVQRTGVRGINRYGRAAQGVRRDEPARGRPGVARSRWSSRARRARRPAGADEDGRRPADEALAAPENGAGRPEDAGDGRARGLAGPPWLDRPRGSLHWDDQRKEVVRS